MPRPWPGDLQGLGMRRGWHHIIVRFGPNTTKDFMARSEPGVVLGEDDIFFIDIGPVYDDTEGDAGDTFVVGTTPTISGPRTRCGTSGTRCASSGSPRAHRQGALRLRHRHRSRLGWKLNMDLSGHRLSDFPHSAHYDGPLAEVDFRPNPNLWVLEIAIVHPDRRFGAFYEDLLLEDQSFPE